MGTEKVEPPFHFANPMPSAPCQEGDSGSRWRRREASATRDAWLAATVDRHGASWRSRGSERPMQHEDACWKLGSTQWASGWAVRGAGAVVLTRRQRFRRWWSKGV
uniref:Uncharacterized protein n=1 Tax=Oryza meridionalis TaxID=40149 RepID=A0A0E0ENE1_9ORYZ